MPFEGNLRQDAISQLFHFISVAHKTGALTLQDESGEAARLYFKRGKLVYAVLEKQEHRLADIMVRAGKLTPAQAERVRENSPTGTDEEMGRFMVQQRMVTADDILRGVADHLAASVDRVAEWHAGKFSFAPDQTPPPERVAIGIRLDPWLLPSAPSRQGPPSSSSVASTPALEIPERKRGKLLAGAAFRPVLSRLGGGLATLAIIAYMTLFGLLMAERGQKGLPADPLASALDALGRTANFILAHPATYYWHKADTPTLLVVGEALINSAGLLVLALGLATLLGMPLGIAAAAWRRKRGTTLVLLLSILAISVPSFLLGMLLWVVNIEAYRRFGRAPLPSAGFGWDAHVVMPVLVLAARPLAQIVQVTYVALTVVFDQDYIRTARGKGLRQLGILIRHALRNALIPILTTLGTSLRFSLASLPVVEFFFNWPGIGWVLLQAIEARNASLVTDLILSLGVLFLVTNLALDLLYRVIDPRLRGMPETEGREVEHIPWRSRLEGFTGALGGWVKSLLPSRHSARPPTPPSALQPDSEFHPWPTRRVLRAALTNPALLLGLGLVLVFFALALFGQQLTPANPYQTHTLTKVDGELASPPFKPSGTFPWGGDPVGRDLQALVLTGARQTLLLALFGMFARVLLGTILGMLSGWTRGSLLDRFVVGAVGVWAAFPATLFAMILILALGIKQGMWVFVVAICVVGWGEIAQTVRGQVITFRMQQYVEGARSLGARSYEILLRHILPNLMPSLIVLGVLELGGILMLLAELGFLNVFLGGGFQVAIGTGSNMSPIVYYYSDVPEWGALLANIRNWWRSSPWLAWYPGLFFFSAILAFNLFGEGLRRFFEESRVNVSRLFNRFTFGLGAAAVVGLVWLLQANAPLSLYKPQAQQFDPQRALQDIRALASPEFQGRESGTPGAKRAADYIAARMKEIGLNPGNDNGTYLLSTACPVFHLSDVPQLEIVDAKSQVVERLVYRQDMVEYIGATRTIGEATGQVLGVAIRPDPATPQKVVLSGTYRDPAAAAGIDLRDKVIIVRQSRMPYVNTAIAAGVLVIADDPTMFEKRLLYPEGQFDFRTSSPPIMYITPQLADRLLITAGSSLADLDQKESQLQAGAAAFTGIGTTVHAAIKASPEDPTETCYHVVGILPGSDPIGKLDSQVIMVAAQYEGVGMGPDGAFYPGANDNASGVAEMLEIARVMKQSVYPPKKTLVFVAWSGGERYEGFSTWTIMNGTRNLTPLSVEVVVELSGVGAGDGSEIALGQGSSFRLTQLFQAAAGQLGNSIATRGRSPHFGLPVTVGFGGRQALSAFVSWDGSDRNVHTVRDTFDTIDESKLKKTGETTTLVLSVLGRETEY